jgi:undecaprenyl-diphosphatase
MTASDGARGCVSRQGLERGVNALSILGTWMGAGLRPVRSRSRAALLRPAWRRCAWAGVAVAAAIAAVMIFIDAAAIRWVALLPQWVNRAFNEFTDFGQSQWFLVPFGVLYLLAVLAASTQVGRFSYGVLGALAVRFGFLFLAIGLPGLAGTIVKRVIGRVRPSALGPYAYEPLSWRTEYASLPSGHTTIAFAALVAIGAVVPRMRAILWIYAVLIALSRIVVSTHFPSDAIAGAAFGAFGAILVRDWFAARRLGFYIGTDGVVCRLPGPSWGRIKKVARALFGQ